MNILTLAITGLMALLAVVFILFLFVAIIFNLKTGENYRHRLANKLDDLRLVRMLGALGIDANAYLHSEKIIDIHRQMERCAACENTDQCDDRLSSNEIAAEDIDFCNNEKDLQGIVKKQTNN